MISWYVGLSGLVLMLSGIGAGAGDVQARQPNNLTPGAAQARPLGGIQLDVEPRRAQVFVDGNYAGIVDNFRGYYQHLTLAAGAHLVEIVATGYVPLSFETTIVPDRTITYRWSLQEASRGW